MAGTPPPPEPDGAPTPSAPPRLSLMILLGLLVLPRLCLMDFLHYRFHHFLIHKPWQALCRDSIEIVP
ncbi:MAG: hypothetical protein ROO73_06270 [Roseivirga sp.]